MQRKLNLVIYDVKNCLSNPNEQNEPFQEHILSSDADFFNHELTRVKEKNFTRVILAETKPAEPLKTKFTLPVLQHHFQNLLPPACEVMFDPFWTVLTDTIADSLKHGAEYIADDFYTQAILDSNHITSIIALANRAASSYPDEPIYIQLSTTSKDIATNIELFFRNHPDFLPNTVREVTLLCHGQAQIDVFEHPITGTGDIDGSFETEEKHTTAKEWHKNGKLPEMLLTPEDVTRRLLAINMRAPEPASGIATTATASAAEEVAVAAAPQPTEVAAADSVSSDELNRRETAIKERYLAGKISIRDVLDFLFTIPKINGAPDEPPSEAVLLGYLKTIAENKIWEKKAKTLHNKFLPISKALTKLWSSEQPKVDIPEIIRVMRENMSSSITDLAKEVRPKLESAYSSFSRANTTTQFYELIVAMAATQDNFNRLEGIKVFCQRFKINYEEPAIIALEQERQASQPRA